MFAPHGNQAVTTSQNNAPNCEASLASAKLLDDAAQGELAAFRALEEPLDMSFIRFKDTDGNEKNLSEWRGKIILFNLWATWCPPCTEEMPFFEELQTKKQSDKFEVVPVSIDLGTDEKPKAFYKKNELKKLPFFQDSTMEAFQQLRKKGVALGMPTTLIVDKNGCALGVLNGPAHWASDDAMQLIDTAIALSEKD
jgi:thiol-disulfide isomerase/thioredoxin